jgi:hypothetical protein
MGVNADEAIGRLHEAGVDLAQARWIDGVEEVVVPDGAVTWISELRRRQFHPHVRISPRTAGARPNERMRSRLNSIVFS